VTGAVDLHCHAAGIGAGGSGCFISAKMRRSLRFRPFLRAFGVTVQELQEEGDGLLIRRLGELLARSARVSAAVVLALDCAVGSDGKADPEATVFAVPNRFVAAEVRKHSGLLFGASVNPLRRDALERLERAADDGAVLMKWLPSIQFIDPADPALIPFYRRMAEIGLPLLVHTGDEHSFPGRPRNDLADPLRLRLPLETGVTVIAAHAAGCGRTGGVPNMERLLLLCPSFPNLYVEISSLTQLNRHGSLPRLLRRFDVRDRLVYGSDMPLINTPLVSPLSFPLRLGLRRALRLSSIENPWDRDVALKEALGVPEEALTRGWSLLRLPNVTASAATAEF
jgi:uncharacterized protein